MTARERNQARANGTLVDPVKATSSSPQQFCVNCSTVPVGKIRCNCSNQPEVFECSHPAVVSGFCLKRLPGQPGDGPIVKPDGSKIESYDSRHTNFTPWPLKACETPRPWEAIICESCPHQCDPPAPLLPLYEHGIDGEYDTEIGHCDVLHVHQQPTPELMIVPRGLRQCETRQPKAGNLVPLIDACKCKLLIVYGAASTPSMAKAAVQAHPGVKVWLVNQDSRQRREEAPGVWCDLPDDLAKELDEKRRSCYAAAIARILE
jgi:hypothetical protein